MQPTQKTDSRRSLPAKIGRGVAIFFLSIILLLLLVLVLIQTAPVQNFARKKVVIFLQDKLQTRVEIKKLDIDFPKMLVLEGVYIEDKNKDTLLAGNSLKVDIDMFKLLSNEILIKEINLNGITAKIKRQLPDTAFNFQFIVDAFIPKSTVTTTTDTSAMKMAIDKIIIDKTRFVYNDIVTGNDVDIYLNHFDTRIDKFDPTNLKYDVPSIKVNGIRGYIRQTKPLEIIAVKTNPDSTTINEAPQYLNLISKEILISDVDLDYSNDISAIATNFKVKALNVHPKVIDMKNSLIALKDIELSGMNGVVAISNTKDSKVVQLTTDTNQELNTEYLPWKFTVDNIRLNDNTLKFDDNTMPRTNRGMDFAHLLINDLTLHADNFLFNRDTIAAKILNGSMREQRGFVLNQLQTDFSYTSTGASLKNLLIATPGTEIKRSAIIRYPSLAALQKNMSLLQMEIVLDNSKIQIKDILTFAPQLAAQPAFKNPNSTIYINSIIRGNMNQLQIDALQFSGFNNTSADLSGTISSATDPNKMYADLNIRSFKTSRADIVSFAPANTIPKTITIPEIISVRGIIKGGMQKAYTNLVMNTSLGSASVKGTISNATNVNTARYDAAITTSNLNLGTIMQQRQTMGSISANFVVKGRGFNPETANATVSGIVQSAEFQQYVYKNLKLDASLADQRFFANAAIKDPNIHLALQAEGNMGGDLPGFSITANVDSIKTLPLHLTPDAMVYRGNIRANFPQFNLDALAGDVFITNSLLVANNQRIQLDTLQLNASYANSQQIIALKTDFINATIQGQYKLTQMGDIFMEAIQPYYAITTAKTKMPDPYNFTIDGYIIDHPTLQAFIPELKRMDAISIKGNFSSSEGINATVKAPFILYGTNTIAGVNMDVATANGAMNIVTNVDKVSAGTNLALFATNLTANVANNKVDFGLLIKDQGAKNKYRINGLFAQEPDNLFSLSLRPDSLLLNYDTWTVNADNQIKFGTAMVNANNFILSKANQVLSINSSTSAANSPLDVKFANFKLATLTGFVQTDSLLADGTLNGNIVLRDMMGTPNFVTDLTIQDLAINKDTIGNVNAKIDNATANVFNTNVTITGRGNDVALTGKYYLKPMDNSNMDLNLAVKSLQLNTLEGASMGSIQNAKGYLSGNVKIGGSATSPDIDGRLNFNNTSVVVTMLNSEFKIDNEALIAVDNTGLKFETFTIRDSANNRVVIDGMAYTKNFFNYNFDLGLRARNFRGLNSNKAANQLYYGQLYFTTNMKITGTEIAPVIDGNLKINEDTKLTVVLPQTQPGVVERDGIIEFVDKDAALNDSLFLAVYDTLNKSSILGMEITANIEVDKKAELNLVIDEGNGDFVKLKGEAILNGGIDKSGKVTLTGSYELEEGAYEMSFNFIQRRFEIQKGSKITWTGEPTDAVLDVTAQYIANTTAIELVQDQISLARSDLRYRQKLPFHVLLNMDGELMKPVLTFDIVLPEESTVRLDNSIAGIVETRLLQLKSEPSELNKQVFALLLLNRFVSENPFESTGGGFNAGTLARQSVSKILTEQLNNLAGDLIAGVDLNFDVVSSEDYTTGELKNKTDLNVGLSKRLLNDRLTVTVGTNFELEGPKQTTQTQTGGSSTSPNINIGYNLTQDGRYMIRAYRRNEYEGIVEGYVVETGVGFIISVDYNRFKEIFAKTRSRRSGTGTRERRIKTDKNQAPEKSANPANTPSTTKLYNQPADKARTEDEN